MSQSKPSKFLITQTLLSAWEWSFKKEDGYEDFLKTLRNERTPPNKQMLEGQRFENVLNATLDGAEIDRSHEWYKPIRSLSRTLAGSAQQVSASKDITVDGVRFVLFGKLDFLKAGIIYDTKFSKTNKGGKYRDSPQHPLYLAIVPEAYKFQYKICDGRYIYTETYTPDEVEPIERTVKQFMGFLDRQNLVGTYCENWKSRY